MIISIESMDFDDPKEFDDILVSPDPKRISIGSMDFHNPKINGHKFILDGLVYVARLESASLKIVQITRRGTRKLLKSLYYTTLCNYMLQVMQSARMKELALFRFLYFSINLTKIKHFISNVLVSFFSDTFAFL